MIIKNESEFKALQEIGRICALTRDEMAKNAVEGITTLELDLIGKKMLDKYGAESAPKKEYDFPGFTCISINDVVAHGIPSNYTLQKGDKVNIDVSASKNGYFSDTGLTLIIPKGRDVDYRLLEIGRASCRERV